ncbi:MAG: Na/Pi cotransporter family protein [Clostridia bacterium]|nr:Na/Pi cotransporter family protein [Clostridia bacterium]
MTIFDVLSMIGGLTMFLLGMSLMGDALEKRAGTRLKAIIGELTGNPARGFLLGVAVTAVIQSSSATTVMVVGFVNSGVMALKQAISIIMGANVGTTVTAWLLSLTGLSGSSLIMQLLKPQSFTPVLALIGIVMYMFVQSERKKDTGMVLLGFAVLMFGMERMSSAVAPLADVPEFSNILLMFSNPIMGVLAGALLTAVIQSSSASVGILQALSATGAITYASAVPIIMGQNIGTCVTALISSIGANKSARRAAMVHLYFNIIGTVVLLTAFCAVKAVVPLPFIAEQANQLGIAIVHTVFNVACTALLLPFGGMLEKLAYLTIPDSKQPEEVKLLDERFFITPSVAIERASSVAVMMAKQAADTLCRALDMLEAYDPAIAQEIRAGEDRVDWYEDQLGTYLVKLGSHSMTERDSHEVSKLLRMIGDLERISDHAVNVLESAEEMADKKLHFSGPALEELHVMARAVRDILETTVQVLESGDTRLAHQVEPLEEVIDNLQSQIKLRHTQRLTRGECTIEMGFILSDLLTDLERVADHCSNIAICTIEIESNHGFDIHQYVIDMDRSNAEAFAQQVRVMARNYRLEN